MTGPVSTTPHVRPSLTAIMAGAALLALSACGAAGPGAQTPLEPVRPVIGAPPEPAVAAVEMTDRAYTPAHLAGRERDLLRVGLLLPFGARSEAARSEASQILRAAELSLFEQGADNVLLLPKDTRGTAEGGRDAAEAALADGADLIIGPLFSAAAEAAGEAARAARKPLIAFSTDLAIAGDGLYLLSFPPQEEVRRVTEHVLDQGATRFAVVAPDTAYGRVARDAYAQTITARLGSDPLPEISTVTIPPPDGAPEDAEPRRIERSFRTGLVASEFYEGGVDSMTQAARRLARLGVERLDPREAARMSGANWTPTPGSAFQVVLLPEGGDRLRMLGPVLVFENIDPLLVKFIGTGLWRDNALVREPALAHGWFAGPEPEARARFESVFQSMYGERPSRLAGLGYDAVALAAMMAREPGGDPRSLLERPSGFDGVDGLFRFRPDGTIERALAVYTIQGGQFRVISPAPEQFEDAPPPQIMDPAGPS
ncbi:penicillin-binding protein activator [Alkalicaulis satelles]|uniref:Penicillin-binding protein activator n=1 Tax=Alkalicaulis satelles TaxID=2609175 RepID=A0A5M6ZJC3_9PROT|nr:penicillin-binding protein activator [Alkalicaulis satelles]KAA5803787.1 penicillin-binding protein activator [Alkalicaulis satelles]